MDQIPAVVCAPLGTKGSQRGVFRVGRPDQCPNPLDDIVPFPSGDNDRTGRDKFQESIVKWFSLMFRVEIPHLFRCRPDHSSGQQPKPLSLQTVNDLSHHGLPHPVWFNDHAGNFSIHV
jgi:hypothetical protein